MPNAVLATIVFLIGIELVDLLGMRRILGARPIEFWVALFTAAVVVVVGVEAAIIVAMALSLIRHTQHGYHPRNSVLVPTADRFWRSVPAAQGGQAAPGLMIYRFSHGLYYANAERFQDEALELTNRSNGEPIRWFVADCAAIDDVDFTAGAMLAQVARKLEQRHVHLVFADISDNVRGELDRSGVTQIVGAEAYFETVYDAARAFERS